MMQQVKHRAKKYAVYDNGEKVLEGNNYDVVHFIGLRPQQVTKYANEGTLVKDKYTIKIIGEENVWYFYKMRMENKEQVTTKKERDVFDYLYRHLKEYGNTVLKTDPSKYIPKLEEVLNEKILVTEKYDKADPYNFKMDNGVRVYRQNRRSKYYILEVM